MNNYSYKLRRIIREQWFERWYAYVYENEEEIYDDSVVIFFKDEKIMTYVLTMYPEMLENDEYSTLLEGLYHDLGIIEDKMLDFNIEIIHLPKELQSNDLENDKIEIYIDNKIQELRTKFNV